MQYKGTINPPYPQQPLYPSNPIPQPPDPTPKTWQKLLSPKNIPTQKILDLYNCEINDKNITEFRKYNWQNLQKLMLGLAWNQIGVVGVEVLAGCCWAKLRHVNLYGNQIGDEGFGVLVGGRVDGNGCGFGGLESINVARNKICFDPVKWGMIQWPIANRIKELELSYNPIGSKGVKLLIKMQLPFLTELWLIQCQLNNQGAKTLQKSNWPILKTLLLTTNNLTYPTYTDLPLNNWSQNFNYDPFNDEEIDPIAVLNFVDMIWSGCSRVGWKLKMGRDGDRDRGRDRGSWGFKGMIQGVMNRRFIR